MIVCINIKGAIVESFKHTNPFISYNNVKKSV
jgi:hypothetical protein